MKRITSLVALAVLIALFSFTGIASAQTVVPAPTTANAPVVKVAPVVPPTTSIDWHYWAGYIVPVLLGLFFLNVIVRIGRGIVRRIRNRRAASATTEEPRRDTPTRGTGSGLDIGHMLVIGLLTGSMILGTLGTTYAAGPGFVRMGPTAATAGPTSYEITVKIDGGQYGNPELSTVTDVVIPTGYGIYVKAGSFKVATTANMGPELSFRLVVDHKAQVGDYAVQLKTKSGFLDTSKNPLIFTIEPREVAIGTANVERQMSANLAALESRLNARIDTRIDAASKADLEAATKAAKAEVKAFAKGKEFTAVKKDTANATAQATATQKALNEFTREGGVLQQFSERVQGEINNANALISKVDTATDRRFTALEGRTTTLETSMTQVRSDILFLLQTADKAGSEEVKRSLFGGKKPLMNEEDLAAIRELLKARGPQQ